MRIAVITADVSHLIHVGGEVDRRVRMFDMPSEMASYIAQYMQENSMVSVSLAVEDKPQ